MNHSKSHCCFTSLLLFVSISDCIFFPVFVLAAAKTLLNKKADVKVRATSRPPTSLPSLLLFTPPCLISRTYKFCLFSLIVVFLCSTICYFPNLSDLTFAYHSSLSLLSNVFLINFMPHDVYLIISLDVLCLVIYVDIVVVFSDGVCLC